MLGAVGDPDADRDALVERLGAEICTDMEHKLVGAGLEARAVEQWRVRAPVCVGRRVRELRAVGAEKLDAYPGAGLAAREVEHVCRQPSHGHSLTSLLSRWRAMCPICSSASPSSASRLFARRRSISSSTLDRCPCRASATMHGKPNFSR